MELLVIKYGKYRKYQFQKAKKTQKKVYFFDILFLFRQVEIFMPKGNENKKSKKFCLIFSTFFFTLNIFSTESR